MNSREQMQQICTYLLNNQQFVSAFGNKIQKNLQKQSYTQQLLDEIIEQISNFLEELIQQKMRLQMNELIEDNNKILQQIKINVEKGSQRQSKIIQSPNYFDTSFTDIRNMINEQKMKVFDRLSDAELEKSISMMEKYQDVVDKVREIQKKVKGLEDRYQTNFKSLWNVLSMTQAAVFDHIKENKQNRVKKQTAAKQIAKDSSSFISSFWK